MRGSIALLVVHGIGSQRRGEALKGCSEALLSAYPEAELFDRNGGPITLREILARELDEAVVQQPSWQVHLYEVYWADILAGPNVASSFHKFLFEETTWFPWFNWKSGLLPRSQYSPLLMWARTAQLWLLGLTATIIHEVVPGKIQSTVLDQIVADVWNYAHSLGRSLQESSPVSGAGEAILGCFRQTVRRAQQDGCRELQIVAHSLGTVIAYNALTRYPSCGANEGAMPITYFYTIGSPLEKFLFIWTRLLRPSLPSPEIQIDGVALAAGPTIRWKNFYSPLDLVSGRLTRFPDWGAVENKRLWGLGGVARAHINYFRHPAFIADLAATLGGHPKAVEISWIKWIRFTFVGILENLLLPVAAILALVCGLALFLLVGAMLGTLCATLLYGLSAWFLNPILGHFGMHLAYRSAVYWTATVCAALTVPLVVLFITKDGYLRARDTHRRFWK